MYIILKNNYLKKNVYDFERKITSKDDSIFEDVAAEINSSLNDNKNIRIDYIPYPKKDCYKTKDNKNLISDINLFMLLMILNTSSGLKPIHLLF